MNPLLEETLALRARYDEEPSHSDHVAALALQIFDGLEKWHGLNNRQRDLLHSAALLHDIGWSQTPDGKGHHKWSARLIQDHPWKNLKKEEIPLVAQIARYHRKTPPLPEHEDFQALSSTGQKLIMIMGGILRVADALDRTHTSKINQIKASFNDKAIIIKVKTTENWEVESSMVKAKSDMLQLAANRPVLCEEL